jgi:hypothetical protein
MAYTTIDDPSAHFQTTLYTGNSGDNAITNGGNSDLQPDWLWIKNRGATQDHVMFDSSRGFNGDNDSLYLEPNNTDAESHNDNDHVKSFNSDGFTMQGGSGRSNNNTVNFVAWQWKANGGTTSSNSDGSITSTVQANTTAGFSIVTYTGTGSTATVGHGLGVKPSVIIIKARTEPTGGVHFGSDQGNWIVYHQGTASDPETDLLLLNETNAVSDSTGHMNDTAPTTSVFTIHTNVDVNESSDTYVAYCFAEKQGYSKFGSYTGNGNADGAFIYTGFKPAWVMVKRFDSGNNWHMHDSKRVTSNPNNKTLYPNLNNAEADEDLDMLSNGFKLRESGGGYNASGGTYIYMAFAEHPFVSSKGVPTTAR